MNINAGVIGLGIIGKPIALRLLKAGFPLFVYDIRAEPVNETRDAGATACAPPTPRSGTCRGRCS